MTVLTCFSKIFERVAYDQMLHFSKLILSDSLSGFLKGHPCATALLKMTEAKMLELLWTIRIIVSPLQ